MFMKTLILTQGQVALVDDEDFEKLSKWKWTAYRGHHTWYAKRAYGFPSNGKSKTRTRTISMHRQIMGLKYGDTRMVDHINHNGTDNRKENLRLCDNSKNFQNQISRRAKYKGINFMPKLGKWRARICLNRKQVHIGLYLTDIEAAQAYDREAKKIFKEFAHLNFS